MEHRPGALFTCLSSRAIHIETEVSLSQKFKKAFAEMDQQKTDDFMRDNGGEWMLWKQNPPSASNMEGAWYNMVSLQTIQTYETNVIMKPTMKPIICYKTNKTQHLNKTSIFTSSLLTWYK